MQHSNHAGGARLGHHGPGIVFGVARVDDHGTIQLGRESQLAGESPPLLEPR